jgi:hypothetical protein
MLSNDWGVNTLPALRFLSLDGAVVLLSSGRSLKRDSSGARIDFE